MIRQAKEKLFEATFTVKEDLYAGNRFFCAGEKFWYVAHVYDTNVQEDCEGDFPKQSHAGVIIVDEEGTEIFTGCREVADMVIEIKVGLEFTENK